jgi:hypothetical protein
MNLAFRPRRIIETVDRRVLGAFEFVDAVTRLPVSTPATLQPRSADVGGSPISPALDEYTLRIRQNRRGLWVILRAPFFDTYTSTFEGPAAPPETTPTPLRLRLGVTDIGEYYQPQEFDITLPRSLDPAAADSIFNPVQIGVLRAPSAPVLDGWSVLRVLVTQAGAEANRLPGVLLRVFRSPRAPSDVPIGLGMTDWRGGIRGEALVAVTGIQRFRPGSGPQAVIETEQAIEFEATRDSAFTGAPGQLPNVPRLVAGTDPGLIRPPSLPAGSSLTVVRPTSPLRARVGREDVIQLAMP